MVGAKYVVMARLPVNGRVGVVLQRTAQEGAFGQRTTNAKVVFLTAAHHADIFVHLNNLLECRLCLCG